MPGERALLGDLNQRYLVVRRVTRYFYEGSLSPNPGGFVRLLQLFRAPKLSRTRPGSMRAT